MVHFDSQQEAPASYTQKMTVPPPVSVEYLGKDGPEGDPQQDQTTSKGDGFWKGCFATVCCCCFLDCCYVESQNICALVLAFCCSCPMYC